MELFITWLRFSLSPPPPPLPPFHSIVVDDYHNGPRTPEQTEMTDKQTDRQSDYKVKEGNQPSCQAAAKC